MEAELNVRQTVRADITPISGATLCRVFDSFDAIADMREEWDEFVAKVHGPVYMSYDWCRIWWEFYGKGKELAIFLFYGNGSLIGIIPIYVDTFRIGPCRVRVARLVGANIPPKVFDPPIERQWGKPIFDQLLEKVFTEHRVDMLSFGPVSSGYLNDIKMGEIKKRNNHCVGKIEEKSGGVYSEFQLPDTFDQYVQSLGKKRRYELRNLKNKYNVKVEVIRKASELNTEFRTFVEMHTAQWNGQGRPGHFMAWPRAMEFNEALVRAYGEQGNLRLVRITANGITVSYQYAFFIGNSCYWQLTARAIGKEWDQLSLGNTGLGSLIELAVEEGIKRIEGGLGHYEYKQRLGAKEYEARIERVIGARNSNRLKANTLIILFSIIDMIYHKVWYRRVQPRLGKFFRRPMWRFWVRLHI
jgi:CelD/BcsL family acetyltransferase involved in cellulose biosynthesis